MQKARIRVNIIKGRQKALEQLLAAEDAKEAAPMAFAVSSLESLALKRQELAASGKIPDASAPARRKIATRRTPWPPCVRPWNASWGWPLPTGQNLHSHGAGCEALP